MRQEPSAANKINKAMRKCLGCKKMFWSESAVDRKCKECRRESKQYDILAEKQTVHSKTHLDMDNTN